MILFFFFFFFNLFHAAFPIALSIALQMLVQQICIEQEALLQQMLEIEEGRPAAVSGAHVGDIIGLGTLTQALH